MLCAAKCSSLLLTIFQVTILYCLGDTESVLNTETGFPFIQIFQNSVQNIAGATVMTAVVVVLTWACANGITTTASRMTWSFARDNGLPFSKPLSRLTRQTKIPWVAVLAVSGVAALLTLIYIGSATAFNDVVSLTITGFYGSYMLPAVLLLWRRIKGEIAPYGTVPDTNDSASTGGLLNKADDRMDTKSPTSSAASDGAIEVLDAKLIWGPWHLPGWLGIINNAFACCYMTFVIFWSVWPPDYHVTASTMNYSIVITGGVMILSAVWYYVYAKRHYHGPLIDEGVKAVLGRGGSVVVAK